VLEFYRRMLKLRRETEELRTGRTAFLDVEAPLLAFTRGGAVLCVFNLSPERHEVRLTGAGAVALCQGIEHRGGALTLHPNGFAIMEAEGEVAVTGAETRASSPVP
jgi:alpha-glucosidase